MKIRENPALHLTYCLNVHPGESWEENFEAIRTATLQIRDRVAPRRPFGLGLRLGRSAANKLAEMETLESFKIFLNEHDLYVFTINGFPYGAFHHAPVKEQVYRPDWRSSERLRYTNQLADILAALLPDEVSGSISTVPGSYREWIQTDSDRTLLIRHFMDCVMHLAGIREATGREVHLAIEPEPDCFLETTEETVAFFARNLHEEGRIYLARLTGASESQADEMITRHLGVCFDACHLSIQFEDLSRSISLLAENGIRLSKVQISAALKMNCSKRALERVKNFCDPVYLHQVKARRKADEIQPLGDLTTALAGINGRKHPEEEWRVHFHLPLYFPGDDALQSTREDIRPDFFEKAMACGCEHFEIETYTFHVFPEELRKREIVESIAEEYAWVLARLEDTEGVST